MSHKSFLKTALKALTQQHGAKHRADIERGLLFCSKVWDFDKNDEQAFTDFCLKHYCPPGKERLKLLKRLDELLYLGSGSLNMVNKIARLGLDVADNPLTPTDELLAAFSPNTHLLEDYRTFNIAALVQLNFGTDDRTTPKTREGWAARRLSSIGREVIPAALLAEQAKVGAEVSRFVDGFNLHLDRIKFSDPSIKFPANTKLVSHWGLRDYMTDLNGQDKALPKQRAIRDLMRRVVDGEIPLQMIDNPKAFWDQCTDTVQIEKHSESTRMMGPLRWANFKRAFEAARKIDPYTRYGNLIDNKFKLEREIPEESIVKTLEDILSSPVAEGVGKYVATCLGRPLEPHDIYFKNFREGTKRKPLTFDLKRRYPNAEALTKAIPGILVKLGFEKKRAEFIGSKIRVDNARSAGHAFPPCAAFDLQLLRVRIDEDGINEMEFGTFMHELGHCVEGVLSSYEMDYRALWGIPNAAFTEGFAFTFQDLSDFILERKSTEDKKITTLLRFWEVYGIAGPALTEILFFKWLYKNPKASPSDMQREVRKIGDEIYHKYYARLFGADGHGLTSVYSHMLWCYFYLADYPVGFVIAYQVRKYLEGKNLAEEMERMCKLGSIYPEQWMKSAIGQTISVKPLLEDTRTALKNLKL
jgi:hypothetical protein